MTVVPDCQYVIKEKVGYAQLTMSKTKEDATYQENTFVKTIEIFKYALQKQRNFIHYKSENIWFNLSESMPER